MITDRTGRHEVLLPINHKNFNFREKKNSQVMKERRENLHKKLTKGDLNFLWPPRLPLTTDGKNIKASACARTLARVITTLNVLG